VTKASNPTPSFNRAALHLATVEPGARFGRIFFDRHSDPLGFGKAPSRFSDPRRRIPSHRFGVVYLGETLKVCFLEAVLRDNRNGAVGDYPMDERELHVRRYAEIEIAAPLSLVDLRGDGAVRMGVPSDVARGSRQRLGRAWSLAFHQHPAAPDGIVYPSRLNGETNLAVYDRATPKLRVANVGPVIAAPDLPTVLDELMVALV
jgi:RES domain